MSWAERRAHNKALKEAEMARWRAEQGQGASPLPEPQSGPPYTKPVPPKPAAKNAAAKVFGANDVIQYDNGIVTASPTVSSRMYGNRFNTNMGSGLPATQTITALQFYVLYGCWCWY